MSARTLHDEHHRTISHIAASVILIVACVWIFVASMDGPSVRFGSRSGSDIYKTAKLTDAGYSEQAWTLWVGVFSQPPLPVHASFLFFDFKQNLRRWPNVAGDISRSPPYALAA
jgi:hypothetical protein